MEGSGRSVKAVIFDCDGVLVDSEPLANRCFQTAIAELGLNYTFEQVCDRFVGLSMKRCMELLGEELGRPLPESFLDELQDKTFAAFERELKPVAGIESALDQLDLPTCVASSGDHTKMRLTLGLTGLLPRFEGRLYSSSQVERGKPAPDLFLFAAAQLGVSPERCAVIEDSVPGVLGARAAGAQVFGYAARTASHKLEQAGALVFRSMEKLPALLRATR